MPETGSLTSQQMASWAVQQKQLAVLAVYLAFQGIQWIQHLPFNII